MYLDKVSLYYGELNWRKSDAKAENKRKKKCGPHFPEHKCKVRCCVLCRLIAARWGEDGRWWRVRVWSKHWTRCCVSPVVWSVDEDDVVVPDDELLLVPARLLPPQRHHPLLVADEHHRGLAQLRLAAAAVVRHHRLADLVHILLAVARRVATLKHQRPVKIQIFLCTVDIFMFRSVQVEHVPHFYLHLISKLAHCAVSHIISSSVITLLFPIIRSSQWLSVLI